MLFNRRKAAGEENSYTALSETQLMWRQFLRHRVAVVASVVLIILYTVVIFANFFAPYGMLTTHKYHLYAPPQITKIRFIDTEGNWHLRPFIYRQVASRDPRTLRFVYKDDPEKTAAGRRGDHFTLGDIGYLDEDGYLYLCDRAADTIISGGVNVYPQEAENLLITHPKVADAAVFGVPNADLGEEVKAVVEVLPGIAADAGLEDELIEFCRAHLASIKCPRTVDFAASFPRLPTGKLYKRGLRDQYWRDAASAG